MEREDIAGVKAGPGGLAPSGAMCDAGEPLQVPRSEWSGDFGRCCWCSGTCFFDSCSCCCG